MHQQKNKMTILLLSGILGCILMAASDWLMIWGDTHFQGNLAWLTVGAAGIAPWRNATALLLAFPAVVFYSIALFGMKGYLQEFRHRKIYGGLTAVGMTPWLCLHLFYIMILYLFSWLSGNGEGQLAHSACEALFRQYIWLAPLGQAVMLLPFVYLIYAFAAGKSVFSRWMALNNPLLIYVLLKGITMLLPDCPFRLAFTNGLMSESMALWFLIFLLFGSRARRS